MMGTIGLQVHQWHHIPLEIVFGSYPAMQAAAPSLIIVLDSIPSHTLGWGPLQYRWATMQSSTRKMSSSD